MTSHCLCPENTGRRQLSVSFIDDFSDISRDMRGHQLVEVNVEGGGLISSVEADVYEPVLAESSSPNLFVVLADHQISLATHWVLVDSYDFFVA